MRRRLFLVALIGLPLLELYLIWRVSLAIGAGATVLLVVVLSLAGGAVLRRAGARAWRRIITASAAGTPPGPAVLDGAVELAAGVLLFVPGLFTGALGLLLLVPGVRVVLRRPLGVWLARRGAGPLLGRRWPGRGRVVDTQIVDEPAGPRTEVLQVEVLGTDDSRDAGSRGRGAVVDAEVVDEVVDERRPGERDDPPR